MSALYPLRMNSKYQSEIEQLENMGFNGNEATQYLEENDGNVVRVVEKLLQNEPNDSEDEFNDQNGEQNGEEEPEPDIIENNNANNYNNSIIYDLNQIVDEITKDFITFYNSIPINIHSVVCSKLMIFIWFIIIIILPIIISIHNGHCKNIKYNKTSNINTLKNGYVYLIGNDQQYLGLDLLNEPILTSNRNIKAMLWKLEMDNNNNIQLKNTQNNKYLNIYNKKLHCTGNKNHIFSTFKLYNINYNNMNEYSVILQTYSNKYLSHTPRWWNRRKCNSHHWPYKNNKHCIHVSHSHRNYRSQWIVKYINNTQNEPIARDFDTIYDFEDDVLFNNDDVILKHLYHYDSYLQSKTEFNDNIIVKNEIINNGGIWFMERIIDIKNENEILIKLKNKLTNKYLRIIENNKIKSVNIGGNGGKYTVWKVTLIIGQNHNFKAIRLESVHYSGYYIIIKSNGQINVTNNCDGDIDCVLMVLTKKRSDELINLKNKIKIKKLEKEVEMLKEKNEKCNQNPSMLHEIDEELFQDLNLDEFFEY